MRLGSEPCYYVGKAGALRWGATASKSRAVVARQALLACYGTRRLFKDADLYIQWPDGKWTRGKGLEQHVVGAPDVAALLFAGYTQRDYRGR